MTADAAGDLAVGNRTVVARVAGIDGWDLITLSCGHESLVLAGMPVVWEYEEAPCPQCLGEWLSKRRAKA